MDWIRVFCVCSMLIVQDANQHIKHLEIQHKNLHTHVNTWSFKCLYKPKPPKCVVQRLTRNISKDITVFTLFVTAQAPSVEIYNISVSAAQDTPSSWSLKRWYCTPCGESLTQCTFCTRFKVDLKTIKCLFFSQSFTYTFLQLLQLFCWCCWGHMGRAKIMLASSIVA